MKRKTLTTDAGTIAYWISDEVEASRDTLFFMHGMTADHTMFDQQCAYFEGRYNVIAWDAPCHGQSRPYSGFSFDASADCMLKILRDNGITDAVLIGQSLGGYFAQAFIRKYPERCRGFVSIGSTPFGNKYYSRMDRWILRQVEWMARLYPLEMMKRAMARQVSVTKRGYYDMLKMLVPYGKDELCHLMGLSYAAFLDENSDMDILCPVLLLIGEHDRTGKVRAYNDAWTKETGYPLIRIHDASHNANVDNPEAVNRYIEAFVLRGGGNA